METEHYYNHSDHTDLEDLINGLKAQNGYEDLEFSIYADNDENPSIWFINKVLSQQSALRLRQPMVMSLQQKMQRLMMTWLG